MTNTARVYGSSLYDLAVSEERTEEILQQLGVIRQLLQEHPAYPRLLMEPSIAFSERSSLIDAAFAGAHQYVINFLKLSCERGILGEFGGCCDEFVRRYNADHGIVCANVVSAVALTALQQQALAEKLQKISGKKVQLSLRVDPSLLGGMKVEMDGCAMDGTVSGRLSTLQRRLKTVTV